MYKRIFIQAETARFRHGQDQGGNHGGAIGERDGSTGKNFWQARFGYGVCDS